MATHFQTLDLQWLNGTQAERKNFLSQLASACSSSGFFYLINHGIPENLTAAVLKAGNQFFDLDKAAKNDLHIQQSAHFRGYSEMKNERDWREQIHFSLELPASEPGQAAYTRLNGPNQWPAALGSTFRQTMLDFIHAANAVGEQLLNPIKLSPQTQIKDTKT